MYATHLRKTVVGIDGAVDEVFIKSCERNWRVSTLINHFVPVRGAEQEYERALETIEALPADLDFHFDIYPFDGLLLPFYTFLAGLDP